MKVLQTDLAVVRITAWMAVKNRSAQRIMGALVCLVLSASGASAATLNVVDGQLMGASGVIVAGSSYNVAFLGGTCIDLYNGCDSVSDFTFQTEPDALLASQALLDQVFIDGDSGDFDLEPSLTNYCGDVSSCNVATPYGFGPFGGSPDELVLVGVASNHGAGMIADEVHAGGIILDDDPSLTGSGGYAVWTPIPVPEPGTAVLMGLGLLGLGVRKRADR
jgi:hypothetical protein